MWKMESLLRSFKSGFVEVGRLSFPASCVRFFGRFATLGKSFADEDRKRTTEARRSLADGHPEVAASERGGLPKPNGEGLGSGGRPGKFWPKFRAQGAPPVGKEFRSLRNDDFPRKKRSVPRDRPPAERKEGSEILFGISPCSLALAGSRRTFSRLFLKSARGGPSPALEAFSRQAEERGIPVKMVPRKVLDRLCHGGVHQGVCLEATPLHPIGWREGPSHKARGATLGETPGVLWLALEGIQDPMNLGAVLRSAHFLGVDGIVMSRRNSCPLTPVVSKASSGAMEVLEVFSTDNLQGLLKTKSEEGWEVLGTVAHSNAQETIPVVSCLEFRWTKPTILVLGNEGHGLSPETRRLCHRMLTISPGRTLEPGIESLNVSVAAGILLHSICTQKSKASQNSPFYGVEEE